MNGDKAPTCPVSFSQEPANPRGTAALRLPSIPTATDLPSLIRSVNIMRDILRTLTTSLTVNNFYGGRVKPSKQYGKRDYIMSDYFSDWYQTGIDNKEGFVGKDKNNRAYVERMDAVRFRNNARDNSQIMEWRYPKPLTGPGSKGSPFQEDYFERIIAVKWKKQPKKTFAIAWRFEWTAVSTINHVPAGAEQCEDVSAPFLWGGLYYSASSTWKMRLISPSPYPDPKFVVSGEPSVTTSGFAQRHFFPQIFLDRSFKKISKDYGTVTATTEIIARSYGKELRCFGGFNPWTGKMEGQRGYAPSQYSAYNPGPTPDPEYPNSIDSYDVIEKLIIDSRGITARYDGKPLKRTATRISITRNVGAFVQVEFEQEKKK